MAAFSGKMPLTNLDEMANEMAKRPSKDQHFMNFESAPEAPKNSKSTERRKVEIRGAEIVGALRAARAMIMAREMEALEAMKDLTLPEHVKEGTALKAKPAAFTAVDGIHTATCGLTKQSRTPLSVDETAVCERHGLPLEPGIGVVTTFIFNPEYTDNPEFADMIAKIQGALKKLKLPENIIQKVTSGGVSIVTDATIEAVFKLSPEACAEVLPIVMTQTVRPQFQVVGNDISPIINIVSEQLRLPQLREQLAVIANDPSLMLDDKKRGAAEKAKNAEKTKKKLKKAA